MQPVEDTDYDEDNYDEDYDEIQAAPSPDTGSSSASTSDDQYDQEDEDEQDDQLEHDDEETFPAPVFKIPSRTISAVEHPFLIMDLDKGLETFGPNPQFNSVSSGTHLV